MSINFPTKEQIRASILAIWQAERPDADSTKYSDLWLFSRIGSVLVYRLHKTLKQTLDAVFPTSSFGIYLDNWLNWVGLADGQGGFGRILPNISSATDGVTCTATGGGPGVIANAWQNEQLTDTAGKTYEITEAHGAVGAGSSIDLDIESVDTGFDTNLESGTVLTFVGPPAGSDSTATLAKDLTGGTDLEEDSAGQARLLAKLRNPPASGNVASWVDVIEAVSPGNLKAYVWPQRQNQPYGYGLTDYCALYTNESGTDRHIAAADDMYTDIAVAVSAGLPALIYRNSRQLTMTSVPTTVGITVTLGDDATNDMKCDWDAEGNPTTVSANDAGGPNIDAVLNVCAPTVTNGIEVGHKVVINGVEGIVTAVNVGADASIFAVSDWPDGWPTGLNALAGYQITSGGGFIGWITDYDNSVTGSGLVEAVRVYMDDRGPNVAYNGAQSQIPGWDSTARIQQLESACFVVGEGFIVGVSVGDLGGGVIDLSHAAQSGATALIYDIQEIAIWQVFA
jgi:hypothetical protein